MPIDVASYLKFTPTDDTGSFAADTEGAIYYDDSESLLKHYDGSNWGRVSRDLTGLSCKSLYDLGHRTNGIYWITADGTQDPYPVYCEQNMDGGGWTRILKNSPSDNEKWDVALASTADSNGFNKSYYTLDATEILAFDNTSYTTSTVASKYTFGNGTETFREWLGQGSAPPSSGDFTVAQAATALKHGSAYFTAWGDTTGGDDDAWIVMFCDTNDIMNNDRCYACNTGLRAGWFWKDQIAMEAARWSEAGSHANWSFCDSADTASHIGQWFVR